MRELPMWSAGLKLLRIAAAGGKALTLDQALEATSTDGIVVLHRDSIVLERYFNGMTERARHILMSDSRSMLGLLAGILAGKGTFDVSRPVTDVISELRATA